MFGYDLLGGRIDSHTLAKVTFIFLLRKTCAAVDLFDNAIAGKFFQVTAYGFFGDIQLPCERLYT